MPLDDDHDDERPGADRLLPPDDRLWRHPSELGPPAPVAPRRRRPAVAALAGAGLAGAVLALGVVWFAGSTTSDGSKAASPSVRSTTAVVPPASRAATFSPNPVPTAALADRIAPSVALVRVERDGEWTQGTALWIDRQGTLAASVPEVAGAETILVVGTDGHAQSATVVGVDEATGVAALAAERTSGTPVDDAGRPTQVGEAAAVIGAAAASEGGEADRATVAGVIVRAASIRSTVGELVLHDSVQVDRSLPSDVTGAAVVDAKGRLLGMVVGNTDDHEVGAVTPGTVVVSIAAELRDHGSVRRAWLGVRSIDLDPALANLLGLPGGAVLTRVDADSPADRAGLETGDIVTAIDEDEIDGASDLVVTLRARRPGTQASVEVQRGADHLTTEVTLGG